MTDGMKASSNKRRSPQDDSEDEEPAPKRSKSSHKSSNQSAGTDSIPNSRIRTYTDAYDLLVLTRVNNRDYVFKVLSSNLKDVSSVWRKILDKNNGFAPLKRQRDSQSGDLLPTTLLEDASIQAIDILLKIIHEDADIPEKVKFNTLFDIAIFADQFDCVSLIKPRVGGWIDRLKRGTLVKLQKIATTDRDTSFINWFFIAKVFKSELESLQAILQMVVLVLLYYIVRIGEGGKTIELVFGDDVEETVAVDLTLVQNSVQLIEALVEALYRITMPLWWHIGQRNRSFANHLDLAGGNSCNDPTTCKQAWASRVIQAISNRADPHSYLMWTSTDDPKSARRGYPAFGLHAVFSVLSGEVPATACDRCSFRDRKEGGGQIPQCTAAEFGQAASRTFREVWQWLPFHIPHIVDAALGCDQGLKSSLLIIIPYSLSEVVDGKRYVKGSRGMFRTSVELYRSIGFYGSDG